MSLDPILLTLIYSLLLSVLKAQQIQVSPEVWGYVGQQEAILPCQFTQRKDAPIVTQVQWSFRTSEGESQNLVVSNKDYGKSIEEKYKDKLDVKEYSLVIKNVDVADAGLYICRLWIVPDGSFIGDTTLIVSEQRPLSAGVVAGIVVAGILLLGVTAAAVYVIVLRQCNSFPGNDVSIETQSEMRAVSGPSAIKRQDVRAEVIYTDVLLKRSDQKRAKTGDEHVTYSEVKATRKKPDEPVYTQVMRL